MGDIHGAKNMKVLFICNQNLNRSTTAEEIFRYNFEEARSAGLYNAKPVTAEELEWADVIVVMEDRHRTEISERFPKIYLKKRILSLNIPDIYQWHQPELVDLIELKLKECGLLSD